MQTMRITSSERVAGRERSPLSQDTRRGCTSYPPEPECLGFVSVSGDLFRRNEKVPRSSDMNLRHVLEPLEGCTANYCSGADRVNFWEGLELEAPVAEASRHKHTQAIVAGARDAVSELSESDAEELRITVITRRRTGSSADRRPAVFDTPSAWSRPGLAPTRFNRDDSRGCDAGCTHPNPGGPDITHRWTAADG
jgi:hypothetical protein